MSIQRRSDELVDLLRPDFVGNDGTASPSFVWVCAGIGSAAAPGFRFCADPDTGFYRPGVNQIGFTTGAIACGLFNANGQLQINRVGVNAGILLGGDALWYRSAANTMRTPDEVRVDNALQTGSASSQRQQHNRSARWACTGLWNINAGANRSFTFLAGTDKNYLVRTWFLYTPAGAPWNVSYNQWHSKFYVLNPGALSGQNSVQIHSSGGYAASITMNAPTIAVGVVSVQINNIGASNILAGTILVEMISDALPSTIGGL